MLSGSGCSGKGCLTGCQENWEEHDGHCYLWGDLDMTKSWYEAEEFCRKEGGHLASVTSEAINEYIFEGKRSKDISNIWLGGSDKEEEGVWKWSDGTPWKFELWNHNSVGQNCLIQLGYNDREWNDFECTLKFNFVCSHPLYSGENDISVRIYHSFTFPLF